VREGGAGEDGFSRFKLSACTVVITGNLERNSSAWRNFAPISSTAIRSASSNSTIGFPPELVPRIFISSPLS
jgi:hypothetical protein